MHKVTRYLLRGCYYVTASLLVIAIFMLASIRTDTLSLGHTLMLVREICSTGAAILLVSVLGSAILHERLSSLS